MTESFAFRWRKLSQRWYWEIHTGGGAGPSGEWTPNSKISIQTVTQTQCWLIRAFKKKKENHCLFTAMDSLLHTDLICCVKHYEENVSYSVEWMFTSTPAGVADLVFGIENTEAAAAHQSPPKILGMCLGISLDWWYSPESLELWLKTVSDVMCGK